MSTEIIKPQTEEKFNIEDFDLTPEQVEYKKSVIMKVDALDKELGLSVPSDEPEIGQNQWKIFNKYIREMYDKGYIKEEEIDSFVEIFYNQNEKERDNGLQRLYYLILDHSEEVEVIDSAMETNFTTQMISDIADLLPENLREEFFYNLENGKEMPAELRAKIASDTSLTEQNKQQLNGLLNAPTETGQTINTQPVGKILSPEDLAKRFNIDPSKLKK
jgi:hypothetical protein